MLNHLRMTSAGKKASSARKPNAWQIGLVGDRANLPQARCGKFVYMCMSIGILVPPASTWQSPVAIPAKLSAHRINCKKETWEDLAVREQWREAVLSYLKLNWRGATGLWKMINQVAAESLPQDRWELRENKKLILRAVGQLVRERIVLRHRRKWIALIDVGHETIPLDRIPGGGLRRL